MKDRYGLSLTAGAAAAAAYVAAVDNLLAAGPDLAAGFEAALAIEPGFALARIGLARACATYGMAAQAKAAAAAARVAAAGASERERSHVDALALVVEGRAAEALVAIRAHLARFPRDALVLQPAAGIFGLIGFSGRLERETELLELLQGLAPHYGDDWWFGATLAFAECECGHLADAAERIGRSLEAAPHNGNAAHVQAHVHYELGRPEEGARFLAGWVERQAAPGLMHGHLSWHRALAELAQGHEAAAWAQWEEGFGAILHGRGPPTPPLNVITDTASWLWRTELAGAPVVEAQWRAIAAFAGRHFPQAGVVFADLHRALAAARVGDEAALAALVGQLALQGTERPAAAVAARLAGGLAAFGRGDAARAADLLLAMREENMRVGGSRAQRELVDRTLLAALRRAGRDEAVAALLERRPVLATGV
jgi:hypothetical protein